MGKEKVVLVVDLFDIDLSMFDIDFFSPQEPLFHQTILPYNKEQEHKQSEILISGFPYDEGTKRNGGRVGGHIASSLFRKSLQQLELYPHYPIPIYDTGDIEKQQELEHAHVQLYEKNKTLLEENKHSRVLFAMGGSNDQSYPNVRALLEVFPKSQIGVINIDSHFDVRPLKEGLAHSGSPFRQMLENQTFSSNKSKFVEFAVKGLSCSNNHYQYLQQHKAEVYFLEKHIRTHQTKTSYTQAADLFNSILEQLSKTVEYIFVSFDVDAINSKWMPGVSAPSVIGGLTAEEAFQIMHISGKNEKVKLVDCSQWNPAVQSLISGKVIGQMFWSFAMGVGKRKKLSS